MMLPTRLWVIYPVVAVVFAAFTGIFIGFGTKDNNTSNAVGLELLAEGIDSTVDIIAIHGLDGHWNATWTADNQKFWIKDFLPDVIPHARIFSYGYDSRTHGSSQLSTQSIYDIGRDIVVELAFARHQTNTSWRPIIFIAHCLGGIVVKSALSYSQNLNEDHLGDQKAVKLSTYGILFIGCPHQGGTGATLAVILARMASIATSTNTKLLQHLQRHSEFLQEQQDRFLSISGDFVIKFFYEMYKTPVPRIGDVHIVPQDSAIIPGTVDAEIISLPADHRNMVRFRSWNDKGFKDISGRLKKMAGDALSWDPQDKKKEFTNNPYDNFNVPFRLLDRDDKFTGRGDILSQLSDVLNSSEDPRRRTVVLYGTGGVGKTAIAIEYAHMQRSAFSSVFWIDGSSQLETRRSFGQAAKRLVRHYAKYQNGVANYTEIAAKLHLDGLVDSNGLLSEDSQASDQIVDAVKEWLANERNHQWLLVFDNYGDFNSFRVHDFFPQSPHGSIIVTSRRRDFDKSWAGIEVDDLNMDEALQLLKEIANLLEERVAEEKEMAVKLLSELGCLPLAIRHAGSYIFTRNLPLEEFLNLYGHMLVELVTRRQPKGSRSDEIVFATWEISFSAVKQSLPIAAELLQLTGFLAREDIWDGLLRYGYYDLPKEDSVENSIHILCAYSLIKCNNAGSLSGAFSIHPLVHSWTRERSNLDVQRNLSKQALELIARAAQEAGAISGFERRIIPHLSAAFDNAVKYLSTGSKCENPPPPTSPGEIDYPYLHRIFEVCEGWYFWAWGKVEDLQRCIRARSFPNIESGSDIWRLVYKLGYIYQNQGYHGRAEAVYCWAISEAQVRLPKKHPAVLEIVGDLAQSILTQARYGEALAWYNWVYVARRNVLGGTHPSTMGALIGIARGYGAENRFEKAEKLLLTAYTLREKQLGKEDLLALDIASMLGNLYSNQGDYDKAGEWFTREITGYQNLKGKKHPDTWNRMHKITRIYINRMQWAEAERLYAQAVDMRKVVLGQEHPDTLHSMRNLAYTYYNQNRWTEAEKLHAQVMEARKVVLGQEHPKTLHSMRNLALTYYIQRRWAEAEKLYAQVVEARKVVLGQEHPDTLNSMHNLAATYYSQKRWREAEKLYVQVTEARKVVLGQEHPDTLRSMHGLAGTYYNQNRWAEAEKLYAKVIEARKVILGQEHPDTLNSMHNFADTYYSQKRWTEAEKLYVQVIEARKVVLGQEHPDTLSSTHGLAGTYYNQNRWAEAEKLYAQVIEARKVILGQEHPDTLNSMHNFAVTYYNQKRWTEAEKLYAQVIEARKVVLGQEHPDTLNSMHGLADKYYTKSGG